MASSSIDHDDGPVTMLTPLLQVLFDKVCVCERLAGILVGNWIMNSTFQRSTIIEETKVSHTGPEHTNFLFTAVYLLNKSISQLRWVNHSNLGPGNNFSELRAHAKEGRKQ